MGVFYFDESDQLAAGFTVGCFVYSDAPVCHLVHGCLADFGYRPPDDEFKSSCHMAADPRMSRVRERLRLIIYEHCRVAVLVAPYGPRPDLGRDALAALDALLLANGFLAQRHTVYFDQGILSERRARPLVDQAPHVSQCCSPVNVVADSRRVAGLQLADLAASTCGTMLLPELGMAAKRLPLPPEERLDPDDTIGLDFELWASLRHSFLGVPTSGPDCLDPKPSATFEVEGYGLFVSVRCGRRLREAARRRFGALYRGCIH